MSHQIYELTAVNENFKVAADASYSGGRAYCSVHVYEVENYEPENEWDSGKRWVEKTKRFDCDDEDENRKHFERVCRAFGITEYEDLDCDSCVGSTTRTLK